MITSAGPGSPEWHLTSGDYAADICAVGASLRTLTYRGRDLVVPFGADEIRPVYRGAIIAPWPNRLRDGRYTLHHVEHQAAINEVGRHHALHGLVHWVRWESVDHRADAVTLRHQLVPQDGYPFPLTLEASFELTAAGLISRLTATNTGDQDAPYGCCPHPYLVAGVGRVDDWTLRLPASRRLEVDGRLLPTHTVPVEQVDNDFRVATRIGTRGIDHAFTDLTPDASGRYAAELRSGSTGVGMSWGAWAPWVQVHTADRAEPELDRLGLAVEPMSCPPDAFNAPDGAPLLPPGATHQAEWTIYALD